MEGLHVGQQWVEEHRVILIFIDLEGNNIFSERNNVIGSVGHVVLPYY